MSGRKFKRKIKEVAVAKGGNFDVEIDHDYMTGLNEEQRNAVVTKEKAVQILAGPGSGKTRVLTTRVAHIIRNDNIAADNVLVVTFTRKAAREMHERLMKLLGSDISKKIIMGTFHAICLRFLRIFAYRIGYNNRFKVIDSNQSKSIVKKAMETKDNNGKIDSRMFRKYYSIISQAKMDRIDAAKFEADAKDYFNRECAKIYRFYEDYLLNNDLMDFDDLQLNGLKLFQKFPKILCNIKHVLVDEFQDTSLVQYELIKLFTTANKTLTIVGDPDQSIYGWRAADIANFTKMEFDFKGTVIYELGQNYRSTSNIVTCALGVVEKDEERKHKHLWTKNVKGPPITVKYWQDDIEESFFVAAEIHRLHLQSGRLLKYSDFAILLRKNCMSKKVEDALRARKIPCRMVGSARFFDREEIKDIMAYLSFVDNENDKPSFERIINVPKREIGDKTTETILNMADSDNVSPLTILRKIVKGEKSPQFISNLAKENLRKFIAIIDDLNSLVIEGEPLSEIIGRLLFQIRYEDYLKNSHPKDWESRMQNINELSGYTKTFLNDFDDEKLPEVQSEEQSNMTDLAKFLEVVNNLIHNDEDSEKERDAVVIATIHSAKGLEWPCVFIPGMENGVIPMSTESEERRVFYVGMTRSKFFLYCTHVDYREGGRNYGISPFLEDIPTNRITARSPEISMPLLESLAAMLKRPVPKKQEGMELGVEVIKRDVQSPILGMKRSWDYYAESDVKEESDVENESEVEGESEENDEEMDEEVDNEEPSDLKRESSPNPWDVKKELQPDRDVKREPQPDRDVKRELQPDRDVKRELQPDRDVKKEPQDDDNRLQSSIPGRKVTASFLRSNSSPTIIVATTEETPLSPTRIPPLTKSRSQSTLDDWIKSETTQAPKTGFLLKSKKPRVIPARSERKESIQRITK